MKLGAEPKKIVILGALLLVAVVMLYMNVFSSGDGDSGVPLPTPKPGTVAPGSQPKGGSSGTRAASARRSTEFRPTRRRPPGEVMDPSKVDPTLRVDLLAKLQTVTVAGTGRNIFEFGAAPPSPTEAKKPEPKIIPAELPKPVEIAKPPEPPKAPPIPLKFYGFTSTPRGGEKRGFFLDGEEIVVAEEGDTIKRRYKVIRIGLNTVEMEDLQFTQRQTLRLEEPPGGVG